MILMPQVSDIIANENAYFKSNSLELQIKVSFKNEHSQLIQLES